MSLTISIDNYINESAVIACKINDKETRIRTYALNLAAYAAAEALNRLGINADIKNSLFKITSFAKNFELADVYVNDCRLDIRITFDGRTFTIPKTHEKYNAVPYAYLVIKLDEKKKTAELLGYLDSTKIKYERTDSPYYAFSTDILSPVDSLVDFIKSLKPANKPCSVDDLEKIKELCAAFIDEEISESEKVYFIKHVISCPDCRAAFCITGGFDAIVSQIRNYQELLNDSTLSVLSGNRQEVNEALIANISLVENAQEDEEQNQKLENAETKEDLLAEELGELSEPLMLQDNNLVEVSEEAIDAAKTATEESQPLLQDETELPELLSDTEESLLIEDSKDNILINTEHEEALQENNADELILPSAETNTLIEDTSDELVLSEEAPLEENKTDELILPSAETDTLIEDTSDELVLSEEAPLEENKTDELILPSTETDTLIEDTSDDLILTETEPTEKSEIIAEIKPQEQLSDELQLYDGEADEKLLENNTPDLNLETEIQDLKEMTKDSSGEEELLENLIDSDNDLQNLSEENNSSLSVTDDTLTEIEAGSINNIQPDENIEELIADDLILEDHTESEPIFAIDNEEEKAEKVELNTQKNDITPIDTEDSPIFSSNDDNQTLDTLDELESLEIKENVYAGNEPKNTNEKNEEDKEDDEIKFNLDKSEENGLNSYTSQQPVELNYDELDENESAASNFDFENNKESESIQNTEENNYHKAFEFEEKQPEAENEEIQNLLDDDLMALLADSDKDDTESSNSISYNTEDNSEIPDSTQYYNDEQNTQQNVQNNIDSAGKPDETINSLFENNENPQQENGEKQTFELAQEPVSTETVNKTKKLAILAGLLIVMVAAGGTTLVFNHQKEVQNKAQDTANQGDELFDFQNKGSEEDADAAAIPQDINKSMTNSFSDKPAAITITKLSWQVSEKLAAEASVKEYLQTAGKNIQMNLQNDLANSADIAFNNMVKVSFEIAPDNTMKGMQVLESSGSDKIDEIILRSIKNTLKYVSVPKLKDYKSDYFLTLIINF